MERLRDMPALTTVHLAEVCLQELPTAVRHVTCSNTTYSHSPPRAAFSHIETLNVLYLNDIRWDRPFV
jgi:hypothetical protein